MFTPYSPHTAYTHTAYTLPSQALVTLQRDYIDKSKYVKEGLTS